MDRRFKKDGGQEADFIGCVVFGKGAEFAEKYLSKGIKIAITGRIQTGSYTNKEGRKVYVTDIIVEDQEFAESKAAGQGSRNSSGDSGSSSPLPAPAAKDGFMDVPDDIADTLPFDL